MSNDLMFKATTKAAWDSFVTSWPDTFTDILVDEIGPIVTTPAVLDEDGEIVTPAVVDDHWHTNVRVLRPVITTTDEEGTVTEIDVCAVLAQGGEGVAWIDPDTVSSPSRIWAGGMSYWVPVVEEA